MIPSAIAHHSERDAQPAPRKRSLPPGQLPQSWTEHDCRMVLTNPKKIMNHLNFQVVYLPNFQLLKLMKQNPLNYSIINSVYCLKRSIHFYPQCHLHFSRTTNKPNNPYFTKFNSSNSSSSYMHRHIFHYFVRKGFDQTQTWNYIFLNHMFLQSLFQ